MDGQIKFDLNQINSHDDFKKIVCWVKTINYLLEKVVNTVEKHIEYNNNGKKTSQEASQN